MKQILRKINFKNSVLLLVIMFWTYNASGQWNIQNSNSIENLTKIQFVTPDVGYVVGDYGVFLKTLNGGDTWTSMNIPFSGINAELYFINELEGMISVDHEGIAKTIDGGNTWELMNIGEEFGNLSLTLIDNEVGILTNNNKIYRTTNFGDSWNEVDISNLSDIGGVSYEVEFLDEDIGWICANRAVLKTVDGGLTWEWDFDWSHSDINGISIIQKVEPITENTIFFATTYYNGFYSTVDGGINLEYSGLVIYDIEFFNSSVGYAIDDSYNGPIYITKTTDGGTTWSDIYEYLPEGQTDKINDLHFIDESLGWAVGANGLILKTENGGGTVLSIEEVEFNKNNVVIFPNPADKMINFSFENDFDIKKIQLFDNLGREINIKYDLNENKIMINELSLPNQFYFLVFTLNSGELISELVLLVKE